MALAFDKTPPAVVGSSMAFFWRARAMLECALGSSVLFASSCSSDPSSTTSSTAAGGSGGTSSGGGGQMTGGSSAGGGPATSGSATGGAGVGGSAGGSCGAGGYGGGCTNLTTSPAEVTFSSSAPGVTIRQLTQSDIHYFTYYDVPVFSASCGRLAFLRLDAPSRFLSMSDLDGANPIEMATSRGHGPYLTPDGKTVFYPGTNADHSVDVYTQAPGDPTCGATRMSHFGLTLPQGAHPEMSTASLDAASGQYVFAIAVGSTFHRVRADGTALPDVGLQDPDNADDFHRLRLDPACPNLVAYRRANPNANDMGFDEVWAVDLDDPATLYVANKGGSGMGNGHQLWHPDGRRLGYNIQDGKHFGIATVATSGCKLAADGSGNFVTKTITPSGGLQALFCTWTANDAVLLCETGCSSGDDQLFLLHDDGTTELVTHLDRDCTDLMGDFYAQANAQFIDDRHVAFATDKSGMPEVYIATLPPNLRP